MSKYQQGPWEVERVGREGNPNDPLHYAIHATAFGKSVVVADTLNCSCIFSPDDQEANTALIAAAPDMLAALQKTRANLQPFSKSDDDVFAAMLRRLDAAIAKAEGRS